MTRLGFLACGLLALMPGSVWSSPFDDLASPLPETRASAAKLIHEQHLAPPVQAGHWDRVFGGIDLKKNDAADDLVSRLPPVQGGLKILRKELPYHGRITVPLDSYWQLAFTMQDDRLANFEIQPREIKVKPPSGFSGFWRTYRVDGTTAAIYDYQDGKNLGNTLHME